MVKRIEKYLLNSKTMNYSKSYFLVLYLFMLFIVCSTQVMSTTPQTINEKIDSLIVLFRNNKNATKQINILNQISSLYNKINPDSALYYSDIAIHNAGKNNTKNLFSAIYYQRGVSFKNKGIIDSARFYLFNALDLFENANDLENIILSNIEIGEFYRSINNLFKASEFIKKAIGISNNKNIYKFLPYAYNRLGAVTFELAFRDSQDDKTNYFNISIQYVDTSFFWSKKLRSNNYNLSNYNILGACYHNLLRYNIAITYYEKALKIADITGETIEKPIIYNNIGSNYCKIKNFEKAVLYGLKGYNLADSLGIKNNMIYTAYYLFVTYNDMRDFQNAIKYLQISDSIKSIVYGETYLSKTKELEANYKNRENQLQIEKLDKEKELQNEKMKKQRIIIYSFILILVIIMIFLFFIYRLFLQKKKANERLLQFNIKLENKVNARTEELQGKNKKIEAQNEIYIKINKELCIAKENSEENDRLKSAFLANMSHEIRTPMNGILGFASLLKKKNLTDEKQHEYIDIIEKSGARMLKIINDIIDVSKIESGLMEILISKTNINEQIEYIYTFFKPEVDDKGLQLSFKNNLPSEKAFIKTDKEKVYAILLNLVKNAVKYTNKGSIEFGYILKTNGEPFEIEFYVKDTGIGIAKKRQGAIFERFIQADISDKQALQGAGLGLTITKAYVKMLDGKIWVESEEGKGSIFYFTIPYNAEPEEEIITKDTVSANEEENNINNLKILIVEDDDTIVKLIAKIVEKYCKKVLITGNGVKAVEICKDNPDIDLVLMDIKLPELDGYEATKQIRQFNKEVTIFAQTACALSGDKEKAIEAGCNGYISKPFGQIAFDDLMKKYFTK